MEAAEARRHDLPIPRKAVPGLNLHGQEGKAPRKLCLPVRFLPNCGD